jgi:diadenosine tetraphosphatase ApaH/serine/threonine PP2A family protein phosphatase
VLVLPHRCVAHHKTGDEQRVRRIFRLSRSPHYTKTQQLVLRELLHPRTWKPSEDRSFLLSAEQINQLCDTAESIFREEPSVLQLQGESFVFLRRWGESAVQGRAVLACAFTAVIQSNHNAVHSFPSNVPCAARLFHPQAHFSAIPKIKPFKTPISACPSAPVKIFGDLHGQFGDLMRLFEEYGTPSTAGDITYIDYLFLGDYVDRGSHSLETICLLLALKIEHPSAVHLIRGNHEVSIGGVVWLLGEEKRVSARGLGRSFGPRRATAQRRPRPWPPLTSPSSSSSLFSDHHHQAADINALFGFRLECIERLGDPHGVWAWTRLNALFNYLPLAALIEDRILCMHGGIGRSISRIEQIAELQRPLKMEDGGLVLMDLLWSDPTTNDAVEGVQPSPRGPGLVTFGPDRVIEFCKENELQMIVRAHECVMDGFERFAQGHLITLFSATNYCGTANNAGKEVEEKSFFSSG